MMKAFLQIFAQRYIAFIIIVLLLTVLVVVAIMRDRLLQSLGIINPYIEQKVLENNCHDRCASWCSVHLTEPGTAWENITLYLPRGEMECGDVMRDILGDDIGNCTCGGI
jgi:hypothetical protein